MKHINLEFAPDIEDKHLEIVKSKVVFEIYTECFLY